MATYDFSNRPSARRIQEQPPTQTPSPQEDTFNIFESSVQRPSVSEIFTQQQPTTFEQRPSAQKSTVERLGVEPEDFMGMYISSLKRPHSSILQSSLDKVEEFQQNRDFSPSEERTYTTKSGETVKASDFVPSSRSYSFPRFLQDVKGLGGYFKNFFTQERDLPNSLGDIYKEVGLDTNSIAISMITDPIGTVNDLEGIFMPHTTLRDELAEEEFSDLETERLGLYAASDPFGVGLLHGVSVVDPTFGYTFDDGRTVQDIAREANPTLNTVGNILGNFALFATLYGVGGAALAKSKLGNVLGKAGTSLGTKLAPTVASLAQTHGSRLAVGAAQKLPQFMRIMFIEALKDVAISTPIETVRGLTSGVEGKELAGQVGKGLLRNIGFNVAIYGGSRLPKYIAKNIEELSAATKAKKSASQLFDVDVSSGKAFDTRFRRAEMPRDLTGDARLSLEETMTGRPIRTAEFTTPKESNIFAEVLDDIVSEGIYVDKHGKALTSLEDVAREINNGNPVGINRFFESKGIKNAVDKIDVSRKAITEKTQTIFGKPIRYNSDLDIDVRVHNTGVEVGDSFFQKTFSSRKNILVADLTADNFMPEARGMIKSQYNISMSESGDSIRRSISESIDAARLYDTAQIKVSADAIEDITRQIPFDIGDSFDVAANKAQKYAASQIIREGGTARPISQAPGTTTKTAEAIKENILFGGQDYEVLSNPRMMYAGRQLAKRYPEDIRRIIETPKRPFTPIEAAAALEYLETMQYDLDTYTELMTHMAVKFRSQGQANQILAAYMRSQPHTNVKHLQKIIQDANKYIKDPKKRVVFSAEDQRRALADFNLAKKTHSREGLVDLIENYNRQVINTDLPNSIRNRLLDNNMYSISDLQGIAHSLVQQRWINRIPTTVAAKASSFQAMSHLLNMKTATRNFVNNLAFHDLVMVPGSKFADVADRLFLANKTGFRSVGELGTITGEVSKKLYKGGLNAIDSAKFNKYNSEVLDHTFRQMRKSSTDIYFGVSNDFGKWQATSTKGFARGTALGKTSNLLQRELRTVDDGFTAFYKHQIVESLMKKNNLNTPTQDILEIADYMARYGTFKDDTAISRFMIQMKDVLNRVIGFGKPIKGASGLMTKEMGLGDLVIKYPKVPGNIISRIVDMTPAGYAKAIHKIHSAGGIANLTPLQQSQVANYLGASTTGVGAIGIGALLGYAGIIDTRERTRSVNLHALQSFEGISQPVINLSALGRLGGSLNQIISGEGLQWEDDDIIVAFTGWNEISGSLMTVGAELGKGILNKDSFIDTAKDMTSVALEEMFDTPTLSVLQTAVMSLTYAEDMVQGFGRVVATPIREGISGFIPSPIRSTAQVLDPTMRNYFSGDNIFEQIMQRTAQGIPGVSRLLPETISQTGEVRSRADYSDPGDIFRNILNAYVAPGQIRRYQPTGYTDLLIEIEKELKDPISGRGETTQYPPRSAPNRITFSGNAIELTPQMKNEYQQIAGTFIDQVLQRNIDRLEKSTPEQRLEFVNSIIRQGRERARQTIIRNYREEAVRLK